MSASRNKSTAGRGCKQKAIDLNSRRKRDIAKRISDINLYYLIFCYFECKQMEEKIEILCFDSQ